MVIFKRFLDVATSQTRAAKRSQQNSTKTWRKKRPSRNRLILFWRQWKWNKNNKTFLRQALKSWNTARPEKGFRASDVQGFRVPDWLGPLFWFLVLVWVWSEQQIINDILNATPLAGKKREKGHNHKSADDWATISGWTWTWTPTREPDSLRAQHEDATPFNEICLKTWKTFVIPSFLQDTQQKATKVGTQQK